MKPDIKFRLLLSLSLVCLLGVSALSYFLLDLNVTLEVSQGENSSIPDSVEGRLESMLDQEDAPIDPQNITLLQDENVSILDTVEGRLESLRGQEDAAVVQQSSTRLIGQNYRRNSIDRNRRIRSALQQVDSPGNSSSEPGASVLTGGSTSAESLQLSISETETEYQVLIQIPSDHGLEISTELAASLLTVNGTLTPNSSNSANSTASDFTSISQFTRSFDLTEPVNELGLYTETRDGGLVIGIPKR
ncbi:MAG: Hsp20/alpha crystallin family protein [Gammaproteobacteria bacterium]|jgi:HSP20 family molecular chaperone IbpA|nr:Hsp20/alpha crystallin family protein [Gammaproteobacteria bacterium]MDP6733020.1 Hsp20/alpha crystallin family protein [Gammaproteobacteria bacterium]|tara:strand:- start:12631 stop:13371 length:741 start_codon:yes stop_codon:yes gene_type:complete